VGLDPGLVAAHLLGAAEYLFHEGDVIEDGQVISPRLASGSAPLRFVCRHEMSLAGPRRLVLDLDMGAKPSAPK
jgi:hypothetical protein